MRVAQADRVTNDLVSRAIASNLSPKMIEKSYYSVKMALRTILWIQVQLSAVKEYARSIIRKISKASSWCFYILNYAVDSFGECVSYPVFGIG